MRASGPDIPLQLLRLQQLSKSGGDKAMRPDGLILITEESSRWTALVEAKVGNTDLTVEQVSSYAELARPNGVNALITLSNQFAPLPSHHPVNVPSSLRKKVDLYHWSWICHHHGRPSS